jgi:hypothetical protein
MAGKIFKAFAAIKLVFKGFYACFLKFIWLITEFWKNSAPRAEARGYL